MIATAPRDIDHLTRGGVILADALRLLKQLTVAGVSTAELDLKAEEYISAHGGVSAFLGYQPESAKTPFPAVLCVSINDEVVHGIPSEKRIVRTGDIVSLDLGLSYEGLFVDAALTLCVPGGDKKAQELIDATREATLAGIAAALVGNHIGDIGAAVGAVAKKRGFAVVQDLGGHAIGKVLHERPFIANEGRSGTGEEIVEGMVLAIEPMFSEGKGDIVLGSDHWTYSMRDGSRAAHFEHTILVTKNGPKILTQ